MMVTERGQMFHVSIRNPNGRARLQVNRAPPPPLAAMYSAQCSTTTACSAVFRTVLHSLLQTPGVYSPNGRARLQHRFASLFDAMLCFTCPTIACSILFYSLFCSHVLCLSSLCVRLTRGTAMRLQCAPISKGDGGVLGWGTRLIFGRADDGDSVRAVAAASSYVPLISFFVILDFGT